MAELFLPPQNAKINKHSTFYTSTETFQRRSEASRERMLNYWSKPENHLRISPTAKAVDVYDLHGNFIATYPSSRKAAAALGFPIVSGERNIRKVCRKELKSYHGYMFRFNHDTNGMAKIEPYAIVPRSQRRRGGGWHRDNSYLRKPVRVVYPDGDHIDFPSVNDCAEAYHIKSQQVSTYLHNGKPWKGKFIQFIEN